MPGEYAFEIDSTVGRYWLANGAGFDVVVERGRRIGVIEDVVVDPFTQEVSAVVVRRALSTGYPQADARRHRRTDSRPACVEEIPRHRR